MKGTHARRALVALAAFLLLSPVAGTAIASSDDPRDGGTAVIGADQEPACLNVLLANCNVQWASWTAGVALPGAFRVTPSFSYEQVLVERVDVATNPFTLTYRIKEEAVWTDGRPVSADDFLFTLAVTLDSRNDIGTRRGYELIAQSVKVDEKTVRFVFTRPYGAWRTLFPSILPKHVLEGTDFSQVWQTEIADPATHEPIGSGPFLVTEWARGESLTLSRNPRWWGRQAPFLDAIVVRFIPDTNSRFQAIQSGQVHLIAPQPQLQIADFRGRPDIAVESGPGAVLEHLDFNTALPGHPALREPWLRQAVALAFDREALFPLLYGSISPSFGAHHNLSYARTHGNYVPTFARHAYSPEAAADILRSHACTRGDDGIFSCPGVGRLSFRFSTTTGNQFRARTFDAIQQQLRGVGIELVPRFQTGGILFGTTLPARDYDLIMFSSLLGDDPVRQVDTYGCGGAANFMAYCSTAVTDALNASEVEIDPPARSAQVNEANRILAEDVPTIPLFLHPSFLAYRTALRCASRNPSSEGPTWNAEEWWLGDAGTVDGTPPSTAALLSAAPNAHGWSNRPVTVELVSDDDGGGCVSEISYRLSGAGAGSAVLPGSSAAVTVAAEGTTTLTYFARDRAGNVESARTLTLHIDMSAPHVAASRTPTANAHGWSDEDVTVRFEATDALSGIEGEPAAEVVLSSEGADQGVSRSFTDRAGNQASATVSGISIDKTPPSISCSASPAILQPPNRTLVPVELVVTVTDALSGPSEFRLVSATSSEGQAALGAGDRPGDIGGFELGAPDTSGELRAERAGAGGGRVYTLEYEGADRAGNTARCAAQVSVPHDSGRRPAAARCRVPNVRGKTLVRARSAIRLARCRTGKVSRGYSRSIKKGRVMKQRPRPATLLRSGGKVNVIVSRGAKSPKPTRKP
jgi:peptide/nickel transport system substrate-binding protein